MGRKRRDSVKRKQDMGESYSILMDRIHETPVASEKEDSNWLRGSTDATCHRCGSREMTRGDALRGMCQACFDPIARGYKSDDEEPSDADSRIGIPTRYRLYDQASYSSAFGKELPQAVRYWLRSPRDIVTVTGEPGTGKTWAATSAARILHDAGHWVAWVDAGEAVAKIREEHIHRGSSTTLERMRNCFALVIDDLGVERETDYTSDIFEQVFRHRYNEAKGVLVTTNIREEVWESEKPSLARRLFEEGAVELVA